ncbi:MAG: UDP-N-acetylmuramate--alanine ligase [Verrucomicrobiota bacterium]|jgi:UDP-N-acetylmuramate--alanine ligase|nr:UDP-N-acetylmuramate--alanine ligase [Verrucomicrobiota bacterium]MDK2963230.1 UDP-N-acetylmuramate--alanine ligase [Verrucomicrobiota bacterium]
MNGAAQLAAQAGYSVSGSDRAPGLEIFKTLENSGIRIVPQDGSGISTEIGAVVYSTAIEQNNPDLVRARELGLPLLHRADMLARLCKGKEVIAVAGTAGKSTVTGMLGWIFQCLGKDPTIYCGARMNNFGAWIRSGKSSLWILEADESDRSFLTFHPRHAVITNISEDHFGLSEVRKLFAQFKTQVSGIVIEQPEPFRELEKTVSLPGKHNLENAANALTLCKALGLDMQNCIAALATFNGIERRLERIGPLVIDDFAHSPVKIAAALEAVSGEFPAFSVYWRPHGYTPLFQGREGLRKVFCDFFSTHAACRLFILPVYYAGGTVEKKITSEQFVEQLAAAGVPAEFVESFQTLETRLREENLPVLGMGARDPELPEFARRIAKVIC